MTRTFLPKLRTPKELMEARRRYAGRILSFSTLHYLGRVFEVHGWTLGRELTELFKVAMQDEDYGPKLRAINMLRQLRLDALRAAGLLASAKMEVTTTQPDGVDQQYKKLTIEALLQQGPDAEDLERLMDEDIGSNPDEHSPEAPDGGTTDNGSQEESDDSPRRRGITGDAADPTPTA